MVSLAAVEMILIVILIVLVLLLLALLIQPTVMYGGDRRAMTFASGRVRLTEPLPSHKLYDLKTDANTISAIFKNSNIEGDSELLSTTTSFNFDQLPSQSVFIEFCYQSIPRRDVSKEIARSIRYVMRYVQQHPNLRMVVYRRELGSGDPEFITYGEYAFAVNLPDSYKLIRIPRTNLEMRMDEYYMIDNEIGVQIEYSESGSRHKSNVVEFILRSLPTNSTFTTTKIAAKRSPLVTPTIIVDERCNLLRLAHGMGDEEPIHVNFPQSLPLDNWRENAIMRYVNDIDVGEVDIKRFALSPNVNFELVNRGNRLVLI